MSETEQTIHSETLPAVPAWQPVSGRGGRLAIIAQAVSDESRLGRAKLYRALSGEAERLGDHVGETLWIENIVCHPIILKDTGEELPRTVLVSVDGTVYEAVSEVISGCVQRLISAFDGQPFTEGPLPLVCTSKRAKGPGNMLLLDIDLNAMIDNEIAEMVIDPPEGPAKKKK